MHKLRYLTCCVKENRNQSGFSFSSLNQLYFLCWFVLIMCTFLNLNVDLKTMFEKHLWNNWLIWINCNVLHQYIIVWHSTTLLRSRGELQQGAGCATYCTCNIWNIMSMHSFICCVLIKQIKSLTWQKKRSDSFPIYLFPQPWKVIPVYFCQMEKKKEVKLTFFHIWKGRQYRHRDNDKLTEIYFNMVYPHSVIVSVACLLLASWKSSRSPIAPLVRGIQFVSKALLASYWDHNAGRCCSSKIKLVSPRCPSEKTHIEPNSEAKLERKAVISNETKLSRGQLYF